MYTLRSWIFIFFLHIVQLQFKLTNLTQIAPYRRNATAVFFQSVQNPDSGVLCTFAKCYFD